MDSRERVLAAFQQRRTDNVPVYHVGFSSEVASALLGREVYVGGGVQQWREAVAWWNGAAAHDEFVERSLQDAIDIAMFCGHDIVRVNYWRYKSRPTRRIDEYTFLYEYGAEADWRVLKFDPPSEQCNICSYVPQDAVTFQDLERQLDEQEAALVDYRPVRSHFRNEFEAYRRLGDEHVIRVNAAGLDIGLESIWLEATALRPDLVERKLDMQVETAARNIRFLAEHGFHFIFGGGDLATNAGTMYSPRVFRNMMLPRLQQVSSVCHACGSFLCFASDGNLWPVADDLFGASGVDAYLEIDSRAGMDLGQLRQSFPGLTLIGNINSTDVALLNRDEITAQTRDCMEFARTAAGVIVGVSYYFVPGTPLDNVWAVLETINKYRSLD